MNTAASVKKEPYEKKEIFTHFRGIILMGNSFCCCTGKL